MLSAPRIVVAGARGFVGRAVVARAAAQGASVVALVRPGSAPTADPRPDPRPVETVEIDHRDPAALAALLREAEPDMVIDAAGRLRGPPDALVRDNLGLTLAWLEALRARGGEGGGARLVVVGSAAQYGFGPPPGRPVRESDPWRPAGAYGAGKAAAALAALAAHREEGLDVQVGVVFNLIGPGQAPHLAPTTFVRRALNAGGAPVETGPLEDERDFLDVDDAARALVGIGAAGAAGGVYNVGSGRATAIAAMLEAIDRLIPGTRWRPSAPPPSARRVASCVADASRLRREIGWAPRHGLADALGRVVAAERAARGPGAA